MSLYQYPYKEMRQKRIMLIHLLFSRKMMMFEVSVVRENDVFFAHAQCRERVWVCQQNSIHSKSGQPDTPVSLTPGNDQLVTIGRMTGWAPVTFASTKPQLSRLITLLSELLQLFQRTLSDSDCFRKQHC